MEKIKIELYVKNYLIDDSLDFLKETLSHYPFNKNEVIYNPIYKSNINNKDFTQLIKINIMKNKLKLFLEKMIVFFEKNLMSKPRIIFIMDYHIYTINSTSDIKKYLMTEAWVKHDMQPVEKLVKSFLWENLKRTGKYKDTDSQIIKLSIIDNLEDENIKESITIKCNLK